MTTEDVLALLEKNKNDRGIGLTKLRKLAKDKKDTALTDAFFAGYLDRIAKAIAVVKAFA